MRHLGPIALIAAALIAFVSLAGFFYSESPKSACPIPALRAAPKEPPTVFEDRSGEVARQIAVAPAPEAPRGGLLALANAPGYRRAGDLSLRVQDCTKAEDVLETKLQEIRGEILEMLMEGTEGSRTCTLSVVIPADKFRGFIADLRGMGKIQSERITASKLKPGQPDVAAADAGPDPRELSLVSIRMADERIAPSVLESRGVLAASFDRGVSHFMKGLAVVVEAFGLILPFVLAFLAVAAPFVVGMRIRRSKAAVEAR